MCDPVVSSKAHNARVHGLLRVLAYPATTAAAVAFSIWALAHGWPAWAVGAAVVSAAAGIVEALERAIPYSRAWCEPRDDRGTDFWHFAISNRAFDVGAYVAIAACTPLGGWLSQRLGVALWPHDWPLVAQALLALILVEMPWYWIHRLEHHWHPLWRVHSVHHSCRRLYWWNLARNHPIDNVVSALASMAPLAFLGVGEAPLALVAAFTGAHAMLQHANADLRTGPLDLFLATARVHRWHHSPRPEESMANYGPTLTLWDWVFGTRRFSAHDTPPEDVGLGPAPETYPTRFLDQMRAPFDARLWSEAA